MLRHVRPSALPLLPVLHVLSCPRCRHSTKHAVDAALVCDCVCLSSDCADTPAPCSVVLQPLVAPHRAPLRPVGASQHGVRGILDTHTPLLLRWCCLWPVAAVARHEERMTRAARRSARMHDPPLLPPLSPRPRCCCSPPARAAPVSSPAAAAKPASPAVTAAKPASPAVAAAKPASPAVAAAKPASPASRPLPATPAPAAASTSASAGAASTPLYGLDAEVGVLLVHVVHYTSQRTTAEALTS